MSHASSPSQQSFTPVSSGATGGYTTGRRMSAVRIHVSFRGSVHAEIVKLFSLVSTWWLLAITLVLIPAMSALMTWMLVFSSRIDSDGHLQSQQISAIEGSFVWSGLGAAAGIVEIVVGIFGVMAITSEYTTSAIQASLTANPRRGLFMNAKATAVVLCTFVVSLAGMLMAWGVSALVASGSNVTPLAAEQRWVPFFIILVTPVVYACAAVIGLGLGAICRSTVGGVFSMVGLFMLLSSVVSSLSMLVDRLKWMSAISAVLPGTAISTFLDAGLSEAATSQTETFSLNWWQSGLVVLVWVALAYVIGLLVVKRSDIK